MSDYRVVYIDADSGAQRDRITVEIERQCELNAREGWYLHQAVPDTLAGTTRGMWLIFEEGESEGEDSPEVLVAERIIGGEKDIDD